MATRYRDWLWVPTSFQNKTYNVLIHAHSQSTLCRLHSSLYKEKTAKKWQNMGILNLRYLPLKVLFSGADFITLEIITINIMVWSTQKVDTLLNLVTLPLEDLELCCNDIVDITTDDIIMLQLGRLLISSFFQVPNRFHFVNSFPLL